MLHVPTPLVGAPGHPIAPLHILGATPHPRCPCIAPTHPCLHTSLQPEGANPHHRGLTHPRAHHISRSHPAAHTSHQRGASCSHHCPRPAAVIDATSISANVHDAAHQRIARNRAPLTRCRRPAEPLQAVTSAAHRRTVELHAQPRHLPCSGTQCYSCRRRSHRSLPPPETTLPAGPTSPLGHSAFGPFLEPFRDPLGCLRGKGGVEDKVYVCML